MCRVARRCLRLLLIEACIRCLQTRDAFLRLVSTGGRMCTDVLMSVRRTRLVEMTHNQTASMDACKHVPMRSKRQNEANTIGLVNITNLQTTRRHSSSGFAAVERRCRRCRRHCCRSSPVVDARRHSSTLLATVRDAFVYLCKRSSRGGRRVLAALVNAATPPFGSAQARLGARASRRRRRPARAHLCASST